MSAAQSSYVIETIGIVGKLLRCNFWQQGATFAHSMELVDGDASTTVLSSLESQGEDLWPATPPWQELHVHTQGNGEPALMLVGRAGSSHWSMSVIVDDSGTSLLFDVACRLRGTPDFLGGTYRLSGADCLVSVSPVVIDQTAPATVKELDGNIVIDATSIAKAPATVRWAYRISLD